MARDIHEDLGLRRVINAAGTMTSLGANLIREEAMAAANAVSRTFVDINELQERASEQIAAETGAEAGFVTACSASGVTVGVAACMAGDELGKIERLPDTTGMDDVVVMQAGHSINYGAPIEQAVRLAGARTRFVGLATEASEQQLQACLEDTDGIAAALYVVSHHTPFEGLIPLKAFAAICKEHGVPVIADMASEQSLGATQIPGVALCVYSSHKFPGGPTAGIVAGRRDLVRAAHLQSLGIGRTMKVGKEGIAGAMAALRAWNARDADAERERGANVLETWVGAFEGVAGLGARVIADWTGNPTDRLELTVRPAEAGLYAWELAQRLREKEPGIYVREQFAERNMLVLDPSLLAPDEVGVVAARIMAILEDTKKCNDGMAVTWADYKRAQDASKLGWLKED